jgi:hypothetical protein
VSDEIVMLDVDPNFRNILSALPGGTDITQFWAEDELHPYTDEDRLRDTRYCWLLDNHGREVANLWMDEGCPVPFNWTEIIRSPND